MTLHLVEWKKGSFIQAMILSVYNLFNIHDSKELPPDACGKMNFSYQSLFYILFGHMTRIYGSFLLLKVADRLPYCERSNFRVMILVKLDDVNFY